MDGDSFAAQQIARARDDPRLAHGPTAAAADWNVAMEAAERVRTLADWGLEELMQAVSHEERRIGKVTGDPTLTAGESERLTAAGERQQLASAEASNQMAELNATTLVAMMSALDALVEQAPNTTRAVIAFGREQLDEADPAVPAAMVTTARRVLDEIEARLPKQSKQPHGPTVDRWESCLVGVQVGPAPDLRPLPLDMCRALQELIAIRHVLVHRAGRADRRALSDAPSLDYEVGQLVRISRAHYREYSAALWTYGAEVLRRSFGIRPGLADLSEWRTNYTLNA